MQEAKNGMQEAMIPWNLEVQMRELLLAPIPLLLAPTNIQNFQKYSSPLCITKTHLCYTNRGAKNIVQQKYNSIAQYTIKLQIL